jgi:hypothetical protein
MGADRHDQIFWADRRSPPRSGRDPAAKSATDLVGVANCELPVKPRGALAELQGPRSVSHPAGSVSKSICGHAQNHRVWLHAVCFRHWNAWPKRTDTRGGAGRAPSQTAVRVGETQSAIESTAKSVEASRTQDDFG